MKDKSSDHRLGFFQFISKVMDWSGTADLFLTGLKKSFQHQAGLFLRRMQYVFVIYLWVSIGAVFFIVGFFDLIMDYAKASKGAVYSIGGLIIFLAAFMLLQTSKIKKT